MDTVDFQAGEWTKAYIKAVTAAFKKRIWFIGLQGSQGRGEATASSDIDMVLILDAVSYEDLQMYNRVLDALPFREKVCGFVSGKAEILAWDKADLFQFCNDTIALYGSLDDLLQTIQREDVERAVKVGACNIYHGCIHNVLHEKSFDILKALYKSASFTLRAIVYLEFGIFEKTQKDLLDALHPQDCIILKQGIFLETAKFSETLFAESSDMLIRWASKWIQNKQM